MTGPKTIRLEVAAKAAIINSRGDVLIIREAATGADTTKIGQWGLTGGRLNPGESFFDCLRREVSEETGLTVQTLNPLYIGEWHPVIRGQPHQIIAIFMLCKAENTKVMLSNEHDNYAWVRPADRAIYPMMEPDRFVVDSLVRAKSR